MTEPTAETIGQRIREAREAANLTQATIAEALGVAVQRVSEYERGKREPGSVTLWKIAKACGVTADALLAVDSRRAPVCAPTTELHASKQPV